MKTNDKANHPRSQIEQLVRAEYDPCLSDGYKACRYQNLNLREGGSDRSAAPGPGLGSRDTLHSR